MRLQYTARDSDLTQPTKGPEMRRTVPTDEGRECGAMLGLMTDKAEAEVRIKFPNHSGRCKSCAFRSGTFPNGCPETLIQAIACVVSGEPFFCHQQLDAHGEPEDICAGWLIAVTVADDKLRETLSPFVNPIPAGA